MRVDYKQRFRSLKVNGDGQFFNEFLMVCDDIKGKIEKLVIDNRKKGFDC